MSATCIPRKKIKRMRLFTLDACGRIVTTGAPVLDWAGFNEFRQVNQIDDGTDESSINVRGETCVNDTGCPVDKGAQFTFTECVENLAFAAITGHGELVYDANGLVVGFNRKKMSGECTMLAAEILFDTPTVCGADGAPQCAAMLIPGITNFKDVNERLFNSTVTAKGTYTAKAEINTRLFENITDFATEAGELAYWEPWIDDIESGENWYIQRLVDCPTDLPAESCDMRAFKKAA